MATQHGMIGWTLVDDDGVNAPTELYVSIDDTKTVAEVIADIQAIQNLAAPLVHGGFIRQELRLAVANHAGVAATPTADADASDRGAWSLRNATTRFTESVTLPTLKDSILTNGKIASDGGAIDAFEAALTSAGANGTQPEGRNYHPFSAVDNTFLAERSSRKAVHARSVDHR